MQKNKILNLGHIGKIVGLHRIGKEIESKGLEMGKIKQAMIEKYPGKKQDIVDSTKDAEMGLILQGFNIMEVLPNPVEKLCHGITFNIMKKNEAKMTFTLKEIKSRLKKEGFIE